MRITTDTTLDRFEFWAGAIENKNRFSLDELDRIEAMLEDIYPEGIDETTLNDIMWFEPEALCEWLEIDFDAWVDRPTDYRYTNYKN